MVLFLEDCQFTVDLTSKHFPYKRKQEIRRRITDYGGTISYILNNKVCQNGFHYKLSTIVQQMLVTAAVIRVRKCSFLSLHGVVLYLVANI